MVTAHWGFSASFIILSVSSIVLVAVSLIVLFAVSFIFRFLSHAFSFRAWCGDRADVADMVMWFRGDVVLW